jgi:hypothetical protein
VTERSFARTAAAAAIVTVPLAVGNLLAMTAAVHFDLGGMSDPVVLLHAGASAAPLWRAGMVLDITGYYLGIVPLVLLLRRTWHPVAASWTDLFALCLLAYCIIGALGGATLATALPTLIRDYAANTGAAHRTGLTTVFSSYTDAVYRGWWNLLEEFLAGVGWIGFGLLWLVPRRRLAMLSVALGAACLVDSVGTALGLDGMASAGLLVYLVLAPAWAAWVGIDSLPTPTGGSRQLGATVTACSATRRSSASSRSATGTGPGPSTRAPSAWR